MSLEPKPLQQEITGLIALIDAVIDDIEEGGLSIDRAYVESVVDGICHQLAANPELGAQVQPDITTLIEKLDHMSALLEQRAKGD